MSTQSLETHIIEYLRESQRIAAAKADVTVAAVTITFSGELDGELDPEPWRVSIAARWRTSRKYGYTSMDGNGATIDEATRRAIELRDYMRKAGRIK